jgi:hypothetical protein
MLVSGKFMLAEPIFITHVSVTTPARDFHSEDGSNREPPRLISHEKPQESRSVFCGTGESEIE